MYRDLHSTGGPPPRIREIHPIPVYKRNTYQGNVLSYNCAETFRETLCQSPKECFSHNRKCRKTRCLSRRTSLSRVAAEDPSSESIGAASPIAADYEECAAVCTIFMHSPHAMTKIASDRRVAIPSQQTLPCLRRWDAAQCGAQYVIEFSVVTRSWYSNRALRVGVSASGPLMLILH